MKRRKLTGLGLLFLFALLLVGCGGAATTEAEPTSAPAPTDAPAPPEVEVSGSVSDGGLLYDKWWKAAGVDEPAGDQALWATQSTNTRSGADTWRCKECHGWDYLGADGAYGSGSHFTGFTGAYDSMAMNDGNLLAILDGSANSDHDFSAMGDASLGSLVTFLQEGMVDLREFIDYENKTPFLASARSFYGEDLYASTCSGCHGDDGRLINFGDDEEPEYVSTIALGNPWEFVHKVRAGQPGTGMPSAIDSGWSMQDVLDVLAYSQTLPSEAPTTASLSRGGRLYDKWWKEAGLDEPTDDMPIWARQDTNTRSGDDTWRCKECHGWDYAGAAGAYGSGSHFTGFPGLLGAGDKSADDLVAQLTGAIDPEHDFSAIADEDLAALVAFIQEGMLEVAPFIDPETKAAIGGDAGNGGELFAATCTACHGDDGRTMNFGSDDDPTYVGTVALDNPWELIHKVRAGQPGTSMPSSIDLGWTLQDVIDVLTFAQSLPTEAP